MAALTGGLLTGCTSPLGNLGRVFPDGSSFTIDEINMQASMTGSGSMVLKGVRCVGTNGYSILSSTNLVGAPGANPTTTVINNVPAAPTVSVPAATPAAAPRLTLDNAATKKPATPK